MRYQRLALPLGVIGSLALAVILGACSNGGSGRTTVLRASGDVLAGGAAVPSGQPVHLADGELVTVRSGTAAVSLPDGGKVELRAGSIVRFDNLPNLLGGDLLATSSNGPLELSTSIADVTVHGVARLQRDLALTVGTYDGSTVVSADHAITVPKYSQETIAAQNLVPAPGPLHLDAADAWDRQYMGLALDVTQQIDGQTSFVDANLPSTTAVYTKAFPKGFTLPSSEIGPVGDEIATAAIALSGPGSFADRWGAITMLRSEGAQWGIIVLQEGANADRVFSIIGQAVADGTFTPPPPAPASSSPASSQIAAAPAPASDLAVIAMRATPTTAPAKAPAKPATPTAPTKHPVTVSVPTVSTPPSISPTTTVPPGGILQPVDGLLGIVHDLLTPPTTAAPAP